MDGLAGAGGPSGASWGMLEGMNEPYSSDIWQRVKITLMCDLGCMSEEEIEHDLSLHVNPPWWADALRGELARREALERD